MQIVEKMSTLAYTISKQGGGNMAQATFSVRMDENLKMEFETLCNNLGMSMSTAINVFARAAVKEKRIPFELSASDLYSKENALRVFNDIRKKAVENGTADMTMEEIDDEIAKVRKGIEWAKQ